MAATLQQIAEFLNSEGLKFKMEDGFIRSGFQTHNYRDTDGDEVISLVITLEEDGEFIKIIAPNVYSYPDGPHKAVLFQLLLMFSWRTKMVQFEYDANDGEVRAIIEFPLEDATLTKRQLMRCVRGIAALVDEYHDNVVAAMEKGELPKEDEQEGQEAMRQEFEEFLEWKRRRDAAAGGQDHGLPTG